MASIQTGISINSPHVTALDTSKMKAFHLSEAPEEQYQSFINAQEKFLKSQYTEHPDTSNHPLYKPYATVQVDGKTVATLYNSGGVSSSNAIGAKIQKLFADDDTSLSGPAGAQERAEKIAELLGGTVEKSSTAITQAQFRANPHPEGTINYAAMHEDPMYEQLQKTKQARTLYLAQQFAQDSDKAQSHTGLYTQQAAPGAEETTETVSNDNDPVEAFLDYMSKTPEERWFDAMLAEKSLTREQYNALPPKEKLAIETEIQEKIRERTAQKAEEGTVTAKQDTDTITASSPTEATQSPPTEGNYPLEYYQLPEWLAQHGNELSSQLGAKPKTEAGSPSDREEYAALIQKHYQSVLKEAGISSVEDYYKATILDKTTSETLHQQMNARIQEDSKLLALMDKLDKHVS